MCYRCERPFVPPHEYAEGEVFDCPFCGRRQVAYSHSMYVWYIYWMKPVRLILKIIWWIILGVCFFWYFLLKCAFQIMVANAVYNGVKSAFKIGDNILHGEPPLGRRK